jgi:hypothetical protein
MLPKTSSRVIEVDNAYQPFRGVLQKGSGKVFRWAMQAHIRARNYVLDAQLSIRAVITKSSDIEEGVSIYCPHDDEQIAQSFLQIGEVMWGFMAMTT